MRHDGVGPAWAPALLFALSALSAPCLISPRPALAMAPGGAAPGVTVTAQAPGLITSIRGDEATLSAGANRSLTVGMELPVLREGREVGRIVLTQVDAASSVGRLTSAAGETVRVADTVALPAETEAPAATPPSPAPPKPVSVPAPSGAARPAYGEHTFDIIPWERWEYMALSSLAVDGLLPGYAARDFQGTRQFTRGELAKLTAKALINFAAGAGTGRDRTFLDRLAEEFRFEPDVQQARSALSEINLPAPTARPATPNIPGIGAVPALARVPGLSFYGGPRYSTIKGGDSKLDLVGRVGGIYDLNDNAFLTLSLSDLHRRYSALPEKFPALDVLTLNFRAADVDWEIGKTYWFSGPVASGDGLLSDNAPSMYMLKGRKTFSWFKGPGRFTYTQIYGGFHDLDRTKYYGLRRLETRLNRQMELGLSEAYVSTKAPNPLIFVLPFYAYQHLEIFNGGRRNTGNDTFNYMVQADLSARINAGFTAYGEFIVDDITAPSGLGAGFNVPRKTAFVIGGHFPKLFGKRGEGRVEIYNADRETYLGIAPQVRWSEEYLLLGSPFGPNTQAFYGRADYRVTDKLTGIVQLRDAVQYHNGQPDVGDRYELSLTGAYDIRPDQSVSVRYIRQRFQGQGYILRPNALEVLATWAY